VNLKDILSISGKPGLYKFISQAKNGIIIESIIDHKRLPAYASDKVSALEDISIFTEADEIKLSAVFDIISEKEDGGKSINHKSDAAKLKAYFEEIVPDYDRDRVYVSDMKKVISWYNTLHENDLLIPSELEKEEETKTEPEVKTPKDE